MRWFMVLLCMVCQSLSTAIMCDEKTDGETEIESILERLSDPLVHERAELQRLCAKLLARLRIPGEEKMLIEWHKEEARKWGRIPPGAWRIMGLGKELRILEAISSIYKQMLSIPRLMDLALYTLLWTWEEKWEPVALDFEFEAGHYSGWEEMFVACILADTKNRKAYDYLVKKLSSNDMNIAILAMLALSEYGISAPRKKMIEVANAYIKKRPCLAVALAGLIRASGGETKDFGLQEPTNQEVASSLPVKKSTKYLRIHSGNITTTDELEQLVNGVDECIQALSKILSVEVKVPITVLLFDYCLEAVVYIGKNRSLVNCLTWQFRGPQAYYSPEKRVLVLARKWRQKHPIDDLKDALIQQLIYALFHIKTGKALPWGTWLLEGWSQSFSLDKALLEKRLTSIYRCKPLWEKFQQGRVYSLRVGKGSTLSLTGHYYHEQLLYAFQMGLLIHFLRKEKKEVWSELVKLFLQGKLSEVDSPILKKIAGFEKEWHRWALRFYKDVVSKYIDTPRK